jgi:hypothetical protein
MKLIYAKVKGQPRNVNTKNGERSVVDAWAANGETLTIWRPANDPAVMRLANGERVQLAIDSKGKVSLVETAYDRAENQRAEVSPSVTPKTQPARPMGFNVTAPFETEQRLRAQMAAAVAPPATTEMAESGRSAEIADYINRLGKLYGHCYGVAAQQLENVPLGTPEVKDVATTIFIQTVRHFSL